jgi:hypothetical protein
VTKRVFTSQAKHCTLPAYRPTRQKSGRCQNSRPAATVGGRDSPVPAPSPPVAALPSRPCVVAACTGCLAAAAAAAPALESQNCGECEVIGGARLVLFFPTNPHSLAMRLSLHTATPHRHRCSRLSPLPSPFTPQSPHGCCHSRPSSPTGTCAVMAPAAAHGHGVLP